MGIHSIIVIKNSKNEYLQYFDKNWESYLFLNCQLPNGDDSNLVISKISNALNINKEFIHVSVVGHKQHKKFSESAKMEKEYIHYFYKVKLDTELEDNEFEVNGVNFKWFSYYELINDERIQKVNSDIIRVCKRI